MNRVAPLVALLLALVVAQLPRPARAAEVATHRSEHFVLTTDVGEAEAKVQLDRLEALLAHLADYWGKPPQGKIECFLVQDLAAWPANSLDERGRKVIEEGFGTTLTQTTGSGGRRQARAQVFASAAGTSLIHEAVHAYCRQTWFEVGPLWYAEGMAEVGQYWRADEPGVHCEEGLAPMLRRSQHWTIEQIVGMESRSAETYGWSWSLCELMTRNPNYAEAFRKFGRALLAGDQLDFVKHFEKDLDKIRFEHSLLAAQFGPGYRAELCAWDWKTQFGPPMRGETREIEVQAARGWQATGLALSLGQRVAYKASGSWSVGEKGQAMSADGAADNRGKLIGVLFKDYELGEPFPLGRSGNFTSPGDGKLYVRCYDDFSQLGDNDGSITLTLPKPEGVEAVAATTPKNKDPKPPKEPKPATPVDAEKRAAAKLRLAKVFLQTDPDAAARRLQEVIDEFPGTIAAAEAAELLK
jgi:hypothetical protein